MPLPGIVAPYMDIRDYYGLCLVQKSFYAIFAPLLFKNPLAVVAGLMEYDFKPKGQSKIARKWPVARSDI